MNEQTSVAHLSAPARAWYQAVYEAYELAPHHERLLLLAAETWDQAERARKRLAKDGEYITDRFGTLKQHPAVPVQRDARLAFARLIRELGLDGDVSDSRPPRIPGRY